MVIDAHAHLTWRGAGRDWEERDRSLIDAADRLGIDQLACSNLCPSRPAVPKDFRQGNEWVLHSMREYPDRILGYCYVNPGWVREAAEEVLRRVDQGFIGVKLYNEYPCNEPVVFPLVELCIELGVPILHHAGHSHYYVAAQPRMSGGVEIAELANRYPEATIICGHIGGGGDWEWQIKALRSAPSAYADTSGSVVDEGMIEMAVEVMGAERVLFACDMSMTAGVGKIRGAQVSDEQKEMILGGNFQRILARRGEAQ
ncbi:MAG: amidohydrolase family protein [Armatimonadota bacterium]|jgi:predicted TIM-barrel fold metal-dependent hydrolase